MSYSSPPRVSPSEDSYTSSPPRSPRPYNQRPPIKRVEPRACTPSQQHSGLGFQNLPNRFEDARHGGWQTCGSDDNLASPNPAYRSEAQFSRDLTSALWISTHSPESHPQDRLGVTGQVSHRLSFFERIKSAFNAFTAEPPLLSPPASLPTSRKNSVRRAASNDSGEDDSSEDDMMAKAMDMNRDRVLDIDDPLLDGEQSKTEKELPFFLRHRGGRQCSTGNPVIDQQNPKPTYRQRRKRPTHKIRRHIDTVDAQHAFIIILAKALLAFGSPSHRIEPQLDSTAINFGLEAQFCHTPGCVQISFGGHEARSSETCLVKSSTGLDLGRIHATHEIYRAVVRDEIYAHEGRQRLEALLKKKPLYKIKFIFFLAFILGALLCGVSFGGSSTDMGVAGVFAVFVMFAQRMASKSELSASGSDIFSAAIVSFSARALSTRIPGHLFCYQSISSASVAGLLPGSVILSGVLDIASRNLSLGAPKVTAGLLTSLYLGFGLTLGSDVWLSIDKAARSMLAARAGTRHLVEGTFHSLNMSSNATPAVAYFGDLAGTYTFIDFSSAAEQTAGHEIKGCYRDRSFAWYLQPLPWWTLFFTLPIYNFCSSMKRGQEWRSVQMVVMVLISCVSSGLTRYANIKLDLSGHPDYVALIGSFVVSVLGNLYSRRFGGTAFAIMLTGILLLIPTGLAEAGGLSNTYKGPGEDEYTKSLDLARKMISVIIGVMSGVYLSARIIYSFGKKKNNALVTF